MNPVVAVIAPGAMGAAVGKRLVDNGLKVLTSLTGRSQDSGACQGGRHGRGNRCRDCGHRFHSLHPAAGRRAGLAQRFAPALTASNAKPVYVDCNAINPKTVERVAAAIAPTGCPFVDAGIIGGPPKPGDAGPRFYASGAAASRFAKLREFGLDIRVLDGALSAASALKMSYAGITKGTQAIGAAMMLAAARAGSADALFDELQASQKEMFRLVQAAARADAAEGLSLGCRNARDRGLRRRRPGSARAL